MTAAVTLPETPLATPVLKWAGGKRQLLPEILPRLPERIETYYEPFVGGGAVFFALANERRFKRAVLCDLNAELVNLYTVVRDAVEELILALAHHVNSEPHYYAIRSRRPEELDPVTRAARTIFLNRTGFNGLYRVNKRGEFNVPFGRHKNPTICDAPRLRAASAALQGVELVQGDFWRGCQGAMPGDAVYLDPPYLPASATANFRSYQADRFSIEDTRRLRGICDWLTDRDVPWLLSNADTLATREIFDGLRIETVQAKRAINSDGRKRGAVAEILVQAADDDLRSAT